MRKIVINNLNGMVSVSRKALHRLRALGNEYALEEVDTGETFPDGTVRDARYSENFYLGNIPRDDPQLIQVIEELGSEAEGTHSVLKIVEIPDDVEWEIESDNNGEWIAEKHRVWRAD